MDGVSTGLRGDRRAGREEEGGGRDWEHIWVSQEHVWLVGRVHG